jgi:uncharacterized membrane protein (UPF0127 family)
MKNDVLRAASGVLRVVCCVLMMFCADKQTASGASKPATRNPQPISGPRVIFPDGTVIGVELAANDETRQQGLMFRDHLPDATGMLFLFPEAGEYPFWMKNTLIPLDMIWIDTNKQIVHVSHDVPPCKADPCPNYPPNAIASYVLEVPAGVAAKHHLADKQTLRFVDLGNVTPR